MLRTRISKSYIKRTFRPTYGWTQQTPKSNFLDPAWNRSVPIWPGMIMTKGVGDQVSLIGAYATTDQPYGFAALYVGGDGIDEPLDAGINTFSVWVMTPDAEAEILAPAFVTSATYTETAGAEKLLYAIVDNGSGNQGKLFPATSGQVGTLVAGVGTVANAPSCRLIKVNSANKITVGGLR